MKNICEECAFQSICKHECKEKNLHDNYVSKDKIIEMIKELEFEIKHAELDKCSQYYDYFEHRKFAINKLNELLEEE